MEMQKNFKKPIIAAVTHFFTLAMSFFFAIARSNKKNMQSATKRTTLQSLHRFIFNGFPSICRHFNASYCIWILASFFNRSEPSNLVHVWVPN